MSLDALIKEHRSKAADLERQIADLREQIEGLTIQHGQVQGILQGLMMAQESAAMNDSDTKKDERRMRLGAKKRVVYMMIKSGFETVGSLTKALDDSDIDSRYIRDVVRKGISSGNILGQIDDKFILSEQGKELLTKAPLPKDWRQSNYERLSARVPHADRSYADAHGRRVLFRRTEERQPDRVKTGESNYDRFLRHLSEEKK